MATTALEGVNSAAAPSRWEALKLRRRRLAGRLMQRRVRSRNFTIISNDCWAGMAYEELAMPYLTPFVGLFVVPEDYLVLLRDLRPCLTGPLEFGFTSRHDRINAWREKIRRDYPIGILRNGVEIHFLHHGDQESAAAKWRRRAARINWQNLRVKFCWHDLPGMAGMLKEFDTMPLPSKLIVGPMDLNGLQHAVRLRDYSTDGTQQYWRAHKVFDIARFLDRGEIRCASPWRLLDWALYWRY